MTAISFSVLKMKERIENGIAETKGLFPFFSKNKPKTKRQTIRKINVSYDAKNRTWEETINLIKSNKRLKYNTIQNTKVLQLYWKQRTPMRELLGTVDLKNIFPIMFGPKLRVLRFSTDFRTSYKLDASERFDLAFRDGFPNYQWLKDWFIKNHGLDIYSYLFAVIRW